MIILKYKFLILSIIFCILLSACGEPSAIPPQGADGAPAADGSVVTNDSSLVDEHSPPQHASPEDAADNDALEFPPGQSVVGDGVPDVPPGQSTVGDGVPDVPPGQPTVGDGVPDVPPANSADGSFVFNCDFFGNTTALPTPTAQKLPAEWKGFNLQFFFNTPYYKQVDENVFGLISSLGFNFIRIPIDYRCMIVRGDWNVLGERALQQLDKVVEYGIKYDIHICINLHRAPGYTVATPPEPTDLWTQSEPQQAFCAMWGAFANRYKNVPNEYLSFNLVNEPPDIAERAYAKVMGAAAQAIWAIDPDRLVIADGIAWGAKPSKMLAELGIAQATRGYQPFNLTHYKAEWVDGADRFPTPSWPEFMIPMYLYSDTRKDVRSVYGIEFDFTEAYWLDINVGAVSDSAKLVVAADGKTIYTRNFVSRAGAGEWKKEVYVPEWNVYQNVYDKDYRVEIPAGSQYITVGITAGDWMSVYDLKFSSVSGTGKTFSITPNNADWEAIIPPLKLDADGRLSIDESQARGRQWLRETYLKPWEDLMAGGCGVMVGEWGAYKKSPHGAVIRWMEDCLINYRDAGIGWALWNFDDAFGPLNSGRADVEYENFNGYRLDREMLELLQKYP